MPNCLSRNSFFALLLAFASTFSTLSFATTLSEGDNKLITMGREQLKMPQAIDLNLDELSRFVGALYEHRNVLTEITARMAVGKEKRVDLVREMVRRNTRIFNKYKISPERVAILERVLFEIPEMADYIEMIAMRLPAEVRRKALMPESFEDVIDRLEGEVPYDVREAIESRIKSPTADASGSGAADLWR